MEEALCPQGQKRLWRGDCHVALLQRESLITAGFGGKGRDDVWMSNVLSSPSPSSRPILAPPS